VTRPAAVALLLAAALGTLVRPAPVAAHEVDPSVRTVIDEVVPAVDGLVVSVGTSVTTQLLVTNDTDQVLEVLADTGEPFLRIGPEGVEANLASPSWYLTNQPFAAQPPPADAAPDAPARWATVGSGRSWGWFDHRLHPAPVLGGLADGERPAFRIPLRLGGEPVTVHGHLERRATVVRFSAALVAMPDASTGLVVQVLEGRAPGLFLRYDGPGEAVVEGADGEPFLRLGPAGAEVNRRSPTWIFTAQARGEDLAEASADPTAAPAWASVSSSPSYAWLDPRALIEEADVARSGASLDWRVPVDVAGRRVELVGRSVAQVVPVADLTDDADDDDAPGVAAALVAVAAVATLALVAWLARGRRVRGRG
jgi:hypothetical protein